MFVRFLAIIVLVGLFSINALAAEKKGKGVVEDAKAAVKSILKDPLSVQFRDIKVNSAGDVCGQYNAKNSYGGYGGFEDFMYDKETKTLLNIIKKKWENEKSVRNDLLNKSAQVGIWDKDSEEELRSIGERIRKLEMRIAMCEE